MPKRGDYFKDKNEAIAFYRGSHENLSDKPDWFIECVIDFPKQFPNYKEYVEVQSKVSKGVALTEPQKKKYGHLKWEKEYTDYRKGQVLTNNVDIKQEGEYDNLALDAEAREKMNKYGLKFGEQLAPDDSVTFRVKDGGHSEYEMRAPIEDVQRDLEEGKMQRDTWEVKPVGKNKKVTAK